MGIVFIVCSVVPLLCMSVSSVRLELGSLFVFWNGRSESCVGRPLF